MPKARVSLLQPFFLYFAINLPTLNTFLGLAPCIMTLTWYVLMGTLWQSEMRVAVKKLQEKGQQELAEAFDQVSPTSLLCMSTPHTGW